MLVSKMCLSRITPRVRSSHPAVKDSPYAPLHPDGKWLATGSSDKTARLWEASTGRALARMQHESDVEAVAVSPDGKWLVTASGGRGSRWLMQPQDPIAEACAHLTRNLTPREWQQYLSEEPYRKTCPQLP